MTVTEYDALRPPEKPRKRRGDGKRKRDGLFRGGDGAREAPMVEDVEFSSYYGRPIIKAPPWSHEIAIYFFAGGLAAGSTLLALGAQLTNRPTLLRNTRLTALGGLTVGTVCLIADLGRPERFLHMLRTIKPTSVMSLGTWVLSGFGATAGVTGALEIDKMTGQKLPLGFLRKVLKKSELPAASAAAVLAGPLASYTGALLANTANPVWNGAKEGISYLFTCSASMAAGGTAMILTPTSETKPARIMAVMGAAGDVVAMHYMKSTMHPVEVEPLEQGTPGKLLKTAEYLTIAGGIGALFGGKNRVIAALSGTALATASALTRFGVLEAGLESAKDPKYVIEPQKARLAARQARGITDDGITTGPKAKRYEFETGGNN